MYMCIHITTFEIQVRVNNLDALLYPMCMIVCIYMYVNVCLYIQYVCMYECVYVCVYVCMYVPNSQYAGIRVFCVQKNTNMVVSAR